MEHLAAIVHKAYGPDYHILSNVLRWSRPTGAELAAAAAAELILRCRLCRPWERLDAPHRAWVDRLVGVADFAALATVCGIYPGTCHWARDRVARWLADQSAACRPAYRAAARAPAQA